MISTSFSSVLKKLREMNCNHSMFCLSLIGWTGFLGYSRFSGSSDVQKRFIGSKVRRFIGSGYCLLPLSSLTGLTRFSRCSRCSSFSGFSHVPYIENQQSAQRTFRYSNILCFPLGMPLLVLRTTFPPRGGTETLVPLTFYLYSRCYMNCASHLHYSLHITHYTLLFCGAI